MCDARQYSDEMHCASCDLRWDTNDPHPPDCRVLFSSPTSKHVLVETLIRCAKEYVENHDEETAQQLQEAALIIERKN